MVCETSCSYHCYVRSFGRGLRQEALEAVTATHQLVAAVHTLGLCTRPLLLAGFPAAAAEAGAPPLALVRFRPYSAPSRPVLCRVRQAALLAAAR